MQILARAIGDPKGINFEAIAEEVTAFAEGRAAKNIKTWGEKAVANWEHKVTFDVSVGIDGGDLHIDCTPSGPGAQIWEWVSRGTGNLGVKQKGAGYPITAGPGKKLPIRKHTPKTSGVGQYVQSGGPGTHSPSKEGPWRKTVEHFGIKPRHFEEAWRVWNNLWWGPGVRDAIKRGIARSTR